MRIPLAAGFMLLLAATLAVAAAPPARADKDDAALRKTLLGLNDLTGASVWRVIQWLPSYWFLALYQQVNGSMHPALEPLARRAWIGLALVVSCMVTRIFRSLLTRI